ncbi:intein-containing Rv2578c family radical SAM protein [Agromyces sp. Soil535]|uniref:intein-containing Rv2578c family radical SAM protein n=1 Tax=Agromyces sp. Soil535 TaxID=1736390 RepID=UPI000702343C|nr:intein-containing Rv2578c family radical SAM protein [Agromyces sp. Soil535]KRE25915.1 radical SAM protein [Agromyces sp. Soil535]
MRWSGQELGVEQADTLPGLAKLNNLVRSVQTPEFAGVTFHEVLAKSALNHVPGQSAMPFAWTINPYRGCSHACVYCIHPDTEITLADGRSAPLWSVDVGAKVIGTRMVGSMRRYVESEVIAKWSTRKRAYSVTLADGTSIIASGDHRFLTPHGWKHVTGAMSGPGQRPYLTTRNTLMGFGRGTRPEATPPSVLDRHYMRGYLTGMIRGDGMMLRREYPRSRGGGTYMANYFRLALADGEALARSRMYLEQFEVPTRMFRFAEATATRREMTAIRTARRSHYDAITELIEWPVDAGATWQAGFLAGIFDAEGSCSSGILRIANADKTILGKTLRALDHFRLDGILEPPRSNGVATVRVRGGLSARQAFFNITQPAITRKLSLIGSAVKTHADLHVTSIEDLGEVIEMMDITTTTGDFIANGVVSHNCFARPTHTYLDLDAGDDFDRQIIVKVNVAEVLRTELAKPSWRHEPVALGTNTDPYQRAEGRYSLMPGIIDALTTSGTPFSILTKGTLLRRDLPQLADAATRVPVDLAMSIAVYDHDLQQSVEPGTPSTKARLATVTAVREAGLECSVFLMPILPYLTDTRAHLDEALGQAKAAGASSVLYTALHLKPGVKEWFMQWLEREHPELVPKYRSMYYGNNAYAPKAYRRWLDERMRPLIRKHGLERGREDPLTGGVRSAALAARTSAPAFDALGAPPDPSALF